jgi:photosystem II stability/assembly factor-like uncharacterized protein
MKRLLLLLFLFCTIAWAHTFHGVSMAPNTLKGWVVTSDTGYIYYTPDCGLTWTSQTTLTYRYLRDIFFLNDQKGWLCTTYGCVYHTENGGIYWSVQVMGLSKNSFRITFINDSCGWVGCRGAIVGQTIDGGQVWQQIWLPYPPFHVDTVDIWGISFVNRQKGLFCAGRFLKYIESLPGQGDTWFRKGQGYIGKSIDGGLNWQLLLRDTINDFFDIKMLDSLNGFVVGGNDRTMSAVVMKTSNGGNIWQNVTIPSQAKYLQSLEFVDNNHAWAVGHNGTIIHSNNEGNTWQMQTSNVNTTLYDVDFADTLHGLIAGDSYVLYTYNSGNTWNIANMGIEEDNSTFNAISSRLEVYPNPAKALTAIRYSLPTEGKASLQFFDISGKLVKTLDNEYKNAGNYSVIWNGTDDNNRKMSEGVYFCILRTDGKSLKQKILMVK